MKKIYTKSKVVSIFFGILERMKKYESRVTTIENNPDLSRIKYYPDRFYMCLDGFDVNNLTSFITDQNIGEQQSIFIHEYYHYLTNITTFPGIRQFHLNFCDRFRLITILTSKQQLNAYPINQNALQDCQQDVNYWNSVSEMINDDDLDYNLVEELASSQNRRFEINNIQVITFPKTMDVEEKNVKGEIKRIQVGINGLINVNSFFLTFGAIDEFLSSSIDEYLYQNDLSKIEVNTLNNRPFYPYHFFESMLSYYGIKRPSAFEKILIAYFALNSFNPPVKLVEILERLKHEAEYDMFQSNPEVYLMGHFKDIEQYSNLLDGIKKFSTESYDQGRIHISQALKYYYDKFYLAQKLKEMDFFYFIRPFFVQEVNSPRGKQKFLLALSRIINVFSPPLILKDKVFKTVDKLTTMGEATLLIIATYEIFESLKTERIAKRPNYLKAKYSFPDNDPNCDVIETFKAPPINAVFQLALNELSLYSVYLDELKRKSSKLVND